MRPRLYHQVVVLPATRGRAVPPASHCVEAGAYERGDPPDDGRPAPTRVGLLFARHDGTLLDRLVSKCTSVRGFVAALHITTMALADM